MSPLIRRMLWSALAGLIVLTVASAVMTTSILRLQQRHEYAIVQESRPLLDAVRNMEDALARMISAVRGFHLTKQTAFTQQYDDAVRDFRKFETLASELARDQRDVQLVREFRSHFREMKELTDKQVEQLTAGREGAARDTVIETAQLRRSSPDYEGLIADRIRSEQSATAERIATMRQWVMMAMVFIAVAVIMIGFVAIWRIEQLLRESIAKQVRRTEAMIAGMADGVLLVDGDGRTVFINPAGQRLLGKDDVGVPITRQTEVYRLRDEHGRPLDPQELPAAQALSTGRPIHDVTILIAREGGERVAVSMSATPLHEDGRTTSVVVTFRDITERRALEEQMQAQAERAQILADAGAFFSSNIDPAWVTQAIAERVAEVMGDWCAVVLKVPETNELNVASIYHRDVSSLGLAWSYIYRQPLIVGEGIIGQVVGSGYPSLTTNVRPSFEDSRIYHASPAKLASLLILPLRTRREMIGALIIAANDPDRAMTDDKLPLAELLGERAALAIENAKLYTEQVEARHKLEDLSRLKDEFLSIASHELRTPVTSIKGYTQLAKMLIREGDLGTSEEYLDIALDQIDRMSRLILELLDVSRIETGRLEIRREPIPWARFVRDVVHHHHTAVSDRRFHINTPDTERLVTGDRDRLEQVLGNLLENAVKYSPEGSDVSVVVEEKGDAFVTSVSDRGIGIPADELSQVFERFHRGRQVSSTNYGGLGLGLYITRQIVDRHGGTIWVESREGQGTTFHFTLPFADESSLLPADEPRSDAAAAGAQALRG